MTTQSENGDADGLDLAQLMDQIRNDAEKRKRDSFRNGVPTAYRQVILQEKQALTSAPDLSLAPNHHPLPPLKIQSKFEKREEYQLSDLLGFHDETFIRNAYEAILKREPDDTGLAHYLKTLRDGRHSKIDILRSLRFSPEGQRANVTVHGLGRLSYARKIYRVPVVGYLVQLAVAIVRLPALITNHRRLESHTMAQFDRVAAHLNDAVNQISNENRKQAEASRTQLENLRQQVESFQAQVEQYVQEQWDTARLQMNSLVRVQDQLMQNYNGLKKTESTLRAELFSKLEETKKREA